MNLLRILPEMFDNKLFGAMLKKPEIGDKFPHVWARVICAVSKCTQGGMIIMSNAVIFDLKTLAKDAGATPDETTAVLEEMAQEGMILTNIGCALAVPAPEPKKKKGEPDQRTCDVAREVIGYLNEKIGSHYRPDIEKNRRLVAARLNEGRTIEDFKTVIDIKCDEWANNQTMSKYLRPETLFSSKFESYLNQRNAGVTARLDTQTARDVFKSFLQEA